MIPSTTAAYGIYPMEASIARVTKNLRNAGVLEEDICVLLPPSHPLAHVVREANLSPRSFFPEPSDQPSSDVLTWLSRFGAVIIPGVAFFVGSRVFLRAVLTSCPEASHSAYSDRLIGLGLSQNEADRVNERLARDGIMVFACCDSDAQARRVREALTRTGAEEASCLEEMTAAEFAATSPEMTWMAS